MDSSARVSRSPGFHYVGRSTWAPGETLQRAWARRGVEQPNVVVITGHDASGPPARLGNAGASLGWFIMADVFNRRQQSDEMNAALRDARAQLSAAKTSPGDAIPRN